MRTDEELLAKAKELAEAKLGWGNSKAWTNQDFLALGKKITDETGAAISHMTWKRLWGKVKYDGLPQTYTLNTLVQFTGYESWRDFVVKNENQMPAKQKPVKPALLYSLVLSTVIICVLFFAWSGKSKIDSKDYSFSSRATRKAGVPNSVVFNFNAVKAPGDSVIIQQSWDTTRRTTVSKLERQHTLLYTFPGYFEPKLIVGRQVVQHHGLLIPSDGWLTAIVHAPVPVYFKKADAIANGKMTLPVTKMKAQNISFTPQPPMLSFCNVRDFGKIYSDDFVFETSVRNDYREGSAVCQTTNIYLLCEGTAINIPLCEKGCESANNLFFTTYSAPGKKKDLSAFGVDFNDFVKVRIVSAHGKATIFIDSKPVYTIDRQIMRSKIIGIDFVFQGTGSVDYVRLSNRLVSFDDEFNQRP
jgi:hypothetical protein